MTEIDLHDSDCATHNEPAYPNGPCDCSIATPERTPALGRDERPCANEPSNPATGELKAADVVERLRWEPGDCPFCGRDPYHYVDNGLAMERVAVVCCDQGIALFQHGDPVLQTQIALRAEAAARIESLSSEREVLREALDLAHAIIVAAANRMRVEGVEDAAQVLDREAASALAVLSALSTPAAAPRGEGWQDIATAPRGVRVLADVVFNPPHPYFGSRRVEVGSFDSVGWCGEAIGGEPVAWMAAPTPADTPDKGA